MKTWRNIYFPVMFTKRHSVKMQVELGEKETMSLKLMTMKAFKSPQFQYKLHEELLRKESILRYVAIRNFRNIFRQNKHKKININKIINQRFPGRYLELSCFFVLSFYLFRVWHYGPCRGGCKIIFLWWDLTKINWSPDPQKLALFWTR